MKRRTSPVVLAFAICCTLAAVTLALRVAPASADEVLLNGDFENWSGSTPANWSGNGIEKSTDLAVSGSAASVSNGNLSQVAPVAGGALVMFRVSVASAGSGLASVTLLWMDSGFVPTGPSANAQKVATSAFNTIGITTTAPIAAAYVQVQMQASGAAVVFDAASVIVSLPQSPTPEPPTATPTDVISPSATPDTPTAATATKSPTKAPTSAPTPTRTTRPSGSPGTSSPTPPPVTGGGPPPDGGSGVPDPGPPPDTSSGGLLANGGFELSDGAKPLSWAKVGGEISSVAFPHTGSLAASLLSDTSSTKWIYQVVGVTPGAWYSASVFALIPSGGGEAFIRVSWYSTGNGSGSAIDDADSATTTSSGWAYLSTGSVQAPPTAFSARVRLMLRPDGPSSADFDDAVFVPADPPAAPTPDASETASPSPTSTTDPGSATASPTSAPGKTATPTSATKTVTPTKTSATGRSSTAEGLVGDLSGPKSLRISEILPDPATPGRDADNEWIELANIGTEPVDLAGWQLGDAKELDPLPSLMVPPGGFVVVAASAAQFEASVATVRVPDGELGSGLNNTGDTIRLLAPGSVEVDTMSYGDDHSAFDPAPAAPASGKTIGAVQLDADPGADNWAETERPTPGEANVFKARAASSATATASSKPGASITGTTPAPSDIVNDLDAPVSEGGGSSIWPMLLLAFAAGAGGISGVPYLIRTFRRPPGDS